MKNYYHFVHTILSIPFCPYHFVPYHFVRTPFCPYHFVRAILSGTILSGHPSNLSTLLHSPTSHHPTTRVYSLIIISFLVSPSSLILFEVMQPLLCVYAASTLWNGLPKDLRQFAHPSNPPLNFTYPPLALSSPSFHSRLKTELFKTCYPGSTAAPSHGLQP